MRLFIAISLPKNITRELARAGRTLQQNSGGGRFVPEANFHVTLHFIGETAKLADAVEAMEESVRGVRPFSLHLTGLGVFDRGIAYAGVDGDVKELNNLHESLECALYDRGFAREYKRFIPHITLARGLRQDEAQRAKTEGVGCQGSFLVNGIRLFESQKGPAGMIYTPLHTESF